MPNQSSFLPAFQTQVTADSWADIFPKASIDLAPVLSRALSPFLSACHFSLSVYLLYFCLRKPRDIHGTEANNVELKTKFFRPYPSNRTITICSEDRTAIIRRILCTYSITCEGKTLPLILGSLFKKQSRLLLSATNTFHKCDIQYV